MKTSLLNFLLAKSEEARALKSQTNDRLTVMYLDTKAEQYQSCHDTLEGLALDWDVLGWQSAKQLPTCAGVYLGAVLSHDPTTNKSCYQFMQVIFDDKEGFGAYSDKVIFWQNLPNLPLPVDEI